MSLWKVWRAKKLRDLIEPTVLMMISGARVAVARSNELTTESYEYRHAVAYGTLKKQYPNISEEWLELAIALSRNFPEL